MRKYPKGVWMHDWSKPVAKTLEARELAPNDPMLPSQIRALGGLYIKGQFNLETQRGREAFSDIKNEIIDEFSFGYKVIQSKYNSEDDCTDLIELEIYEWSPVLVGCNPATQLLSAKAMDPAKTKNAAPEGVQTKGEILGESVEQGMTCGAIRTVIDAIWYCVYDCIYPWGESKDAPIAERVAKLRTAFTEGADLVEKVIMAILNDEGGETAEEAAKWLEAAGIQCKINSTTNIKTKSGELHAGLPLKEHSERVLAAVVELKSRLQAIKEITPGIVGRKAGRALSQARQDRIETHASTCEEMAKSCTEVAKDLRTMLKEASGTSGETDGETDSGADGESDTEKSASDDVQQKAREAVTRFKIDQLQQEGILQWT
jgi:HK97 family phage prohead protease